MPNKQLRCQVSVRIYGEEKCFGPGVAELLERVDRLHSLRKAVITSYSIHYTKLYDQCFIHVFNLRFDGLYSVFC